MNEQVCPDCGAQTPDGHVQTCANREPRDYDEAVQLVHRAFCDPDHELVGEWDRSMADALRRNGYEIRAALPPSAPEDIEGLAEAILNLEHPPTFEAGKSSASVVSRDWYEQGWQDAIEAAAARASSPVAPTTQAVEAERGTSPDAKAETASGPGGDSDSSLPVRASSPVAPTEGLREALVTALRRNQHPADIAVEPLANQWNRGIDRAIEVVRELVTPGIAALPALDEAWKAAEAALPDGWHGPMLTTKPGWPERKRWAARAYWTGHGANGAEGTGPTPAAALQALASRLATTTEETTDG